MVASVSAKAFFREKNSCHSSLHLPRYRECQQLVDYDTQSNPCSEPMHFSIPPRHRYKHRRGNQKPFAA